MGDAAPQLIAFLHRLASQGFIVIAPQYRGSDGGEGKDEIGGSDPGDITGALQLTKSLDYADTRNVFLYGESRGMMTYQAIRDGFPANAAAVFGAFTDLEVMNQSPYVQERIPQIWPDYEQHKDAIIRRRSAMYWPEKLSVPILIMNGTADQQVGPKQPLQLALQLQELHKDYALILYANGNHLQTADRLDRDAQAIAWFRKHLRN
jgi:dipeptidyl aminopeptidase/acylaminoacyl peptidase